MAFGRANSVGKVKARPISGRGFETSCSLRLNTVARGPCAYYPVKARPTARRTRTGARARRMAAVRWKPQLARRTTVLHRERERDHPPVQYPSIVRKLITASAARRARAASSHDLPPADRQPVQWRTRACHTKADCVLEATARTSHHGLAPKERGFPLVQCPFMSRSIITTSVARSPRAARSRISPPPERQPAQWGLRACHANAGCALEVTAHTSHHGLATKERGLPSVRCPSIAQGVVATSAARRTRAASSRVPPPPETQPAQWRSHIAHAKAG